MNYNKLYMSKYVYTSRNSHKLFFMTKHCYIISEKKVCITHVVIPSFVKVIKKYIFQIIS